MRRINFLILVLLVCSSLVYAVNSNKEQVVSSQKKANTQPTVNVYSIPDNNKSNNISTNNFNSQSSLNVMSAKSDSNNFVTHLYDSIIFSTNTTINLSAAPLPPTSNKPITSKPVANETVADNIAVINTQPMPPALPTPTKFSEKTSVSAEASPAKTPYSSPALPTPTKFSEKTSVSAEASPAKTPYSSPTLSKTTSSGSNDISNDASKPIENRLWFKIKGWLGLNGK